MNTMKNNSKKILAILLSTALIVGSGATYASYAAKADNNDSEISKNVENIISDLENDDEEAAVYRNETVFAIASNKGEVNKVIVNDKVKDNVNNTEKLNQSESNEALPVDVHVTYTLDGNEIAPESLAGKSGHVTITYEYENKEARTVNINGDKKELYVPFAVVTGMLLDDNVFSNVTVDGGRVVGDGSRMAAVGIAFPGLKNDLTFEGKENDEMVEIPENFVIEADVTDFKLGNAYTFVTNISMGKRADSDSVTDLLGGISEEVGDAMNSLLDGSIQLRDGISDAYDGTGKLLDGAKAAYAGAGKLDAGAESAVSGAKQLSDGIGSLALGAKDLDGGIDQLSAGLNTIDSNSDALVAGAGQVFDSLLTTANTGLVSAGLDAPALTKDNYAQVIDGALAQLDAKAAEAATQFKAAMAAGLVTPEMKAQVEEGSKALEAGKAKLAELKASLDSYNTFYQGIIAYTAGVTQAAGGAKKLSAGSDALVTGTAALSDGAKKLAGGLDELEGGIDSLEDGLGTLKNGLGDLDDGMLKLKDGSAELSDGLQKLNDELVSKILAFLNDDATELADRLNAIADISDEYKGINELGDAEDGAAKFIYKLGDIR